MAVESGSRRRWWLLTSAVVVLVLVFVARFFIFTNHQVGQLEILDEIAVELHRGTELSCDTDAEVRRLREELTVSQAALERLSSQRSGQEVEIQEEEMETLRVASAGRSGFGEPGHCAVPLADKVQRLTHVWKGHEAPSAPGGWAFEPVDHNSSPQMADAIVTAFSPALGVDGRTELRETFEATVAVLEMFPVHGGDTWWVGGAALAALGRGRDALECWEDAVEVYVDRAKAHWNALQTALNPKLGHLGYGSFFLSDAEAESGLGFAVSRDKSARAAGQDWGEVAVRIYFYEISADGTTVTVFLDRRQVALPFGHVFPLQEAQVAGVRVRSPLEIERVLDAFEGAHWAERCASRRVLPDQHDKPAAVFQVLCSQAARLLHSFVQDPPETVAAAPVSEETMQDEIATLRDENKQLRSTNVELATETETLRVANKEQLEQVRIAAQSVLDALNQLEP